jgi:hypothetical protein
MIFGVIATIVVAVILLFAIVFVAGLGQVKKAYNFSLDRVVEQPDNTDLQEKAVELGRQYAKRLRSVGLSWVFNERALMNEIRAALTEGESKLPGDTASARTSVKQRLAKLEGLRKKGVVTDAEYQRRRQEVLKDRRTGRPSSS